MPVLEIIFPAIFLGLFLLGMWLSWHVFHWGLIVSLICGAVFAFLPFIAFGLAASASVGNRGGTQPTAPMEEGRPSGEKENEKE